VTRIRSLILNDSDVRSVLEGTKRMHAVAVKAVIPDGHIALNGTHKVVFCRHDGTARKLISKPYQAGDMVWVREAFGSAHPIQVADGRFSMSCTGGIPGPPRVGYRIVYRTDGEVAPVYFASEPPYRSLESDGRAPDQFAWCPSIHMPRWASRLTLRVTDVSVERDEGGQWTWMVSFERVTA
jgi:hypothetical protein